MTSIPDRLYFRIGDVAEIAGIKQHVLRYWEGEFPEISPEKSSSGQRVYTRRDLETILLIKKLLYSQKFSIEGARLRLKELRKNGELKAELMAAADRTSPSDRVAREQALSGVRGLLDELESLISRPLRETFKY